MSRLLGLLLLGSSAVALSAEPTVVPLWPDRPPGETRELPPEQDVNKPTDKPVGGRPIIKLTNVSTPTLSIFRPAPTIDTRTAVIVCPGGGHTILAFDHEGTEVATWLNTLGVTGIVLKYRVPARNPERRWEAAVQDAQRAVRLVRHRAAEWNLDPARIGILGFSAGGETAGRTALLVDQATYDKRDAVDDVSCRPDFAVLVYPGGFEERGQARLRDDVRLTDRTPPLFFVHAWDDRVSPLNSLLLAVEARRIGVASELHIYATGGHGFGMRDTGEPINAWPARCGEWLKRQGWLAKKS